MNLKSLLFGSAATLMVVTGAQAADLPMAAEPVDYVKVCDAFGTGFFYIPGTETCMKIGGYVRVDTNYREPTSRASNSFGERARASITIDTRTQTDIGMVRSFLQVWATNGPAGTATGVGAGLNLWDAFVQIQNDIGTFTAGRTGSNFDFLGSVTWNGAWGQIDDPTTQINMLAYTFTAGGGFSGTIAIEDPNSTGRSAVIDNDGTAGQRYPDLVANVRVDQGWGSAALMGALHSVRPMVAAVETELGWAVGAGLEVNVPGTGIGFQAQGTYARGASTYATALGVPDATEVGNDLKLYDVWSIRAGFTAAVTPTITAVIDGSYTDIDSPAAGLGDEQYWAVQGNLRWSPVKGLVIGPELGYGRFEKADTDQWSGMLRVQRSF